MNDSIFQDRGFIYIFWLYCGQGNAIVIGLSTIIGAFHIPKLFLAFYKNWWSGENSKLCFLWYEEITNNVIQALAIQFYNQRT